MTNGFKKGIIGFGVILALILIFCGYFAYCNNTLVALEEEADTSWAQVQNVYQERFDKIPNLVAVVKGYAKHEEEVLTKITEARANAGGVINVDSSILNDEEKMAQFQKVQDELSSSLQRLLVVTENYPELKANDNFLALQNEISEIENKISVERKRFNDKVKLYNTKIRQFPMNMMASKYGFEKKSYFQAVAGSETAPKVEF